MIRTADSVALLMNCYPDGLILTHANHWSRAQSFTMDQATAFLILDRAEPVELPEGVALRVFHWQNPDPVGDPALKRQRGGRRRAGNPPDNAP